MDMDLEQKAIMRLREAADTSERFYKAPLIVTTSGGKDSSVCVALAEKAGIDFEVMHNHTTFGAAISATGGPRSTGSSGTTRWQRRWTATSTTRTARHPAPRSMGPRQIFSREVTIMQTMDMAGTISRLSARVPTDGNVYPGEDGLLYCRRCHTPRQRHITVGGTALTVCCLCRCMAEQRDREAAELKKREEMQRVRRYREAGFSSRELRGCTFAADDGARPETTAAMVAYVEHFETLRRAGKGLLLYGDVGTGKSFFAACIVNALIDQGYPCLMTNFPQLVNEISALWEGKQEYINSLGRLALVAIDDLGVERDKEYMNEQVSVIIDSLYRAKVPMVITSNYTPKQLTTDPDIRRRRVYDRLLERCHPVLVDGPSRRKDIGRQDFHQMNALLGL